MSHRYTLSHIHGVSAGLIGQGSVFRYLRSNYFVLFISLTGAMFTSCLRISNDIKVNT
jgi:hypothetical protein